MSEAVSYKNLKICMVSPSRWRYTKRLVEELCRLGCEVFLFVDKRDNSDISKISSAKCQIKEIWKQSSFFPWYLFKILNELLKVKPSIFHVQFEYLVFGRPIVGIFSPLLLLLLKVFGKLLKFKVVLTMHSVISIDKVKTFEKIILLPFTQVLINLSDKVIVHTWIAKRILVETYGISEKKIIIIPHGIEIKFPHFQSKCEKLREKLGLSNKKIILHFGIVRSTKGLETLLMAFKRLLNEYHEIALVILGWIHEYLTETAITDLLSLIKKDASLRNHVKVLIGFFPEEKLFAYVNESDVICFPYKENYIIGVSGAVADIVMCGKPIVITKCIKFHEFKKFPNIVLTDNDEKSIAEALSLALKTSPKKPDPSVFQNLFWNAVTQKTLLCYQSVIEK